GSLRRRRRAEKGSPWPRPSSALSTSPTLSWRPSRSWPRPCGAGSTTATPIWSLSPCRTPSARWPSSIVSIPRSPEGSASVTRTSSSAEPSSSAASRVPDRARAVPVQALAPDVVAVPAVVDRHLVVVAEGEAEAGRLDVAETCRVGREVDLGREAPAAVGGPAVIDVVQRGITGIHPGSAHVPGPARPHGGEGVGAGRVGARALHRNR